MHFGKLFASVVSLPVLFVVAAPAIESRETIGGIAIGAIINAIGIGIVQDVHVLVGLESLTTNIVSTNFDAKNPLPFELTIDRVISTAGLNGTDYATFDQKFTNFTIPPSGTANSGTFGNVLLPQGAMGTFDIIPFGVLDLTKTDVFVRVATIKGKLGIPLQIDCLKQSNVPTTYDLVF